MSLNSNENWIAVVLWCVQFEFGALIFLKNFVCAMRRSQRATDVMKSRYVVLSPMLLLPFKLTDFDFWKSVIRVIYYLLVTNNPSLYITLSEHLRKSELNLALIIINSFSRKQTHMHQKPSLEEIKVLYRGAPKIYFLGSNGLIWLLTFGLCKIESFQKSFNVRYFRYNSSNYQSIRIVIPL